MPKVLHTPSLILMLALGLSASGCATNLERRAFAPSVTRLATQGGIKKSLDELAEPLISSGRNIGMVVGFATDEEEGIYSYGSKDLEGKIPMTNDAVFQTGSVSKSFLSLLVAELARDGKLRVDDPVAAYLPNFAHFSSRDLAQVTFAELASHTSGMRHEAYNFELLWGVMTYLVNGKNLYRYLDDDLMLTYLDELDFQLPKTRTYAYSNIGYTYLGWILNNWGGSSLDAKMHELVLGPLGLHHTGYSLASKPPADLTPGYAGDLPTFVLRNSPVEPWLFSEGIAGAGGIYSTTADLLRYAKINAGLVPSPLKASLDLTRRPVADAEGGKIAMSWFHKRLPDSGEPYVYIAGIVGGHTSFVGFDESRHLAVVVLQNSINHDDLVGVELLDRLVAAYRLKHDGVEPKAAPKPRPEGEPLLVRRLDRTKVYSSK